MKKIKIDYTWLAEKFESIRTTRADGSPAFDAMNPRANYSDLLLIFETYEDFEPGISPVQRQRLIRMALRAAAASGPITPELLMGEMSRQKTQYREKTPHNDYILVTSISIKRPVGLSRLHFDNADFVFDDELPSRFSRKELDIQRSIKAMQDFPAGFCKARVRVKARSDFDAFETALGSLDYLRGIWNFVINRRIEWVWTSNPVKPVNSIYLGPVHTLHCPTGKLATGTYWFEPVYLAEPKAEDVKNWADVKEHTAKIRKVITRHPYRDYLREAFIRYARSLDGIDHESSFLKFWSLLEWLTAISEEQNYGEVINRVVFLFDDEDYHRKILEHLRIRRNASVHRGEGTTYARDYIYQIKTYVEWMLLTHLRARGRFETPQQLGQMLRSTRDLNTINKNIKSLNDQLYLLETAKAILEGREVGKGRKRVPRPS